MSFKKLFLGLGMMGAALPMFAQTQAADHLVLSEIGIYAPSGYSNAPNSAEFTEIYNPTSETIDLTNYYVTDYERYYELPAIVGLATDNLLTNGSDFLLKFPDGASIPPGGVVVVTVNGTIFAKAHFDDDLNNFYNQTAAPAGPPQVFEIYDSDAAIPDMGTNYNKSAADYPLDRGTTAIHEDGDNMSHTDAGEHCVLFYWDGASSLVKDVDIIEWRPHEDVQAWIDSDSADQLRDKSAQPGYPDGNYAFDNGFTNGHAYNLDVDYGDGPRGQLIRRTLLEPRETHTGGNGINGDDETMELGNLTWEMVLGAPMNGGPGVVDLGTNSDNYPPLVGECTRDIQSPTPGDNVIISVPVFDEGAVTVELMVDKGTGYQSVAMTAAGNDIYTATINTAGLAEGTRVRFYAVATDSQGLERIEADYKALPDSTPNTKDWPGYNVFMVKSSSYQPGDFIVSEIMYNPKDHNNSSHAQYIELHNPGASPVDISDFVVTTDSYFDNESYLQLPSDAVIPPGGYYTISGNETVFLRRYAGMDPDTVADFGIVPSQSFMAHAGSVFHFFDPNVFSFDDEPVLLTEAFKTMGYGNGTPWPEGATTADPTAGNKGYGIELTELTLAAEGDPAKWAIGPVYMGTPNATNALIRTGDVAVTGVTKTPLYPGTADAVTISAMVVSTTAIDNVKLHYKTEGGTYASVDMTTGDNVNYTANIGPFATDNTIVWYYVEATDTSANTGAYPYIAPVAAVPFVVQNTPVNGGIIVNEIMYDPAGGDNGTNSEYVELYNPTAAAIDLSLHMFTRNDLALDARWGRLLPIGTVIPPGGYYVLAPRKDLLVDTYVSKFNNYQKSKWGELDPAIVFDLAWDDGSALTNGDGTTIYLVHPNEVDYFGAGISTPYLTLNYMTSSPWPANGTTLNLNSIELKDPALDYTDPANWAQAVALRGTPGARNSVAPPPASVTDWTLY